jgi:hypothetical protein
MGLDFEHMIKARAHKGGVKIGKTPKKLFSYITQAVIEVMVSSASSSPPKCKNYR